MPQKVRLVIKLQLAFFTSKGESVFLLQMAFQVRLQAKPAWKALAAQAANIPRGSLCAPAFKVHASQMLPQTRNLPKCILAVHAHVLHSRILALLSLIQLLIPIPIPIHILLANNTASNNNSQMGPS